MILAIEGPDASGKSTLYDALQLQCPKWTFIPRKPATKELLQVMHLWEEQQVLLWSALYNPQLTYVCDRFVMVSGPVYAGLRGQKFALQEHFLREFVHVMYIQLSLDELMKRHALRGDKLFDAKNYAQVLDNYESVVATFGKRVCRLDGELPARELAKTVEAYVALQCI